MSTLCTCPRPTALTTVPQFDCPVNFGQIQKLLISRQQPAGSERFDNTTNDPTALATWTPLLSAADDTLVVCTPTVIVDGTIEAGEAITNGGGDNSTLNGEVEVTGTNPSPFTGLLRSMPREIVAALKDLKCEPNLSVAFVNNSGQIIMNEVATDTYEFFPISSFFFGDRNNEGFGTKDSNAISFNLEPCWDDNFIVFEPQDFDAKTFC